MKKLYCLLLFLYTLTGAFCAGVQSTEKLQSKSGYPINRQIDSMLVFAQKTMLSKPEKARKVAENALLLSKRNNYKFGVGRSFSSIGISYWAQSYYPISIFYLNAALPYLKESSPFLASTYRFLGRDYSDLGKYDMSLKFLTRALEIAGKNPEATGSVYSELSLTYFRLKKYDQAILSIDKGLTLCKKVNQKLAIGILYSRLIYIYEQKKQFDKANAYCDSTYQYSVETHNNRLRAIALLAKAYLFDDQQKYPQAIESANHALSLADSLGVIETSSTTRKLLASIYKKQGDKARAFLYSDQYIQLQDSLNKVDKHISVSLIQDYFALTTKLNDIDQIEQKSKLDRVMIKSQRNTIINLAVSILALVISFFILYSYYTQKKRLTGKLKKQNKEVVEQNKIIASQSEHLEELNTLKDRMLAIIGHDLNTPVANLRNMVDMFNQGYFTADEVQRAIRDMDPAIKGAELTLSNLVEWAGSQFKGNTLNAKLVDLSEVMREMENIFKHPLVRKNLNLINGIQTGQQVWADENHVKMIFRNLISNAIKFTPEQGTITVAANPTDGKMVISISDTGKGMHKEEADRLFAADTHFTKTGTQGEKGTGIGLLLCRQLAELNGGSIGVTSEAGVGSTFFITLKEA